MINKDRIVPVQATDLLSFISTVCALASVTVTKIDASEIGKFAVTSNPANAVLCSEPVKAFDFGSSVTAATVYFIADYDFEGFTVNGSAVETAGADIEADGRSLYKAVLADSTITITQVGF